LHVTHRERHDAAIGRMLDQIEARLTVLQLTGADGLAAHPEPDAGARRLDWRDERSPTVSSATPCSLPRSLRPDVLDPHLVPRRQVLVDPARERTRRG
jgi:hypothetical protein